MSIASSAHSVFFLSKYCLYSLYRCHKLPDCIGNEYCVISLPLLSLSPKSAVFPWLFTQNRWVFSIWYYIKPTPPVHLLLRNRTQIGKKTYKNSIESTRKCGSLYSLDNSFPSHPIPHLGWPEMAIRMPKRVNQSSRLGRRRVLFKQFFALSVYIGFFIHISP